MAIITRCCCFDNTRSGSLASGIYSLIYSLIACGYTAWSFVVVKQLLDDGTIPSGDNEDAIRALYITYIVEFVIIAFYIFASILVLIGVSKDQRGLLLPYMIAIVIYILQGVTSWIMLMVAGMLATVYIISMVIWILFTTLNIACLLCVISQFQVLRDGTGSTPPPYAKFT